LVFDSRFGIIFFEINLSKRQRYILKKIKGINLKIKNIFRKIIGIFLKINLIFK